MGELENTAEKCPPLPGRLAERFRARALLGSGAMGRVLRATDRQLDREVAIKLLAVTGDERLMGRARREATALSRVRHPNVLAVFEAGEEEGIPFLVTELLEGASLDEARPGDALATMLQVAEGLEAVHGAGLIHRDVKPANIILCRDGRAVLVDFGLVSSTGTILTRTGEVVGTPAYLAPELLLGEEATPASDWYSWGATLYRLREGKPPFAWETILARSRREPVAIPGFSVLDPDSHEASLVLALLASDPARRPGGAGRIRRWLAEGPGRGGASESGVRARVGRRSGERAGDTEGSGPGRAPEGDGGPVPVGGRSGVRSGSVPRRGGIPDWARAGLAGGALAAFLLGAWSLVPRGEPAPSPEPTAENEPDLVEVWEGRASTLDPGALLAELHERLVPSAESKELGLADAPLTRPMRGHRLFLRKGDGDPERAAEVRGLLDAGLAAVPFRGELAADRKRLRRALTEPGRAWGERVRLHRALTEFWLVDLYFGAWGHAIPYGVEPLLAELVRIRWIPAERREPELAAIPDGRLPGPGRWRLAGWEDQGHRMFPSIVEPGEMTPLEKMGRSQAQMVVGPGWEPGPGLTGEFTAGRGVRSSVSLELDVANHRLPTLLRVEWGELRILVAPPGEPGGPWVWTHRIFPERRLRLELDPAVMGEGRQQIRVMAMTVPGLARFAGVEVDDLVLAVEEKGASQGRDSP